MQGYPDVQQSEQLPSPKSGGSGCPGAPPSPTAEAIAQARDNAMTRYKEKRRTRKYANRTTYFWLIQITATIICTKTLENEARAIY